MFNESLYLLRLLTSVFKDQSSLLIYSFFRNIELYKEISDLCIEVSGINLLESIDHNIPTFENCLRKFYIVDKLYDYNKIKYDF